MRVIAYRVLREFAKAGHADAEALLSAWYKTASKAEWSSFAEVRASFPSVDQVGNRLIFNIGGNKYRVIAVVDYIGHGVMIRFVGTHAEYDRIDPRSV